MDTDIDLLKSNEHHLCERILRGLPEWFGMEDALINYVRDIQAMQTWAVRLDGALTGFLALNRHNTHSAEIHVMAVDRNYHGRGFGRLLVEHAVNVLQTECVEFLEVKTLAPSHPDPHYEQTRGFYGHMGFKPLEENLLWGKANPCLIMIKHLGSG